MTTDPIATNRATMNALYGKTVLWIGNECASWTVAEFAAAARNAKALGFDTICPKRADGGIRRYASPEQITAEADAVRAEGVGYLPFTYLYGPKFPVHGEAFPGETQTRAEAAIAIELAHASGCHSVQLDMEAEYNGAVDCARLLASLLRPEPITVSVSTWADPALQNWEGVAAALAPAVNAWTPQRYTDWLAHQPLPAEETCIQPGVDLTQEFGVNHPVTIATGQPTVFAWEYAVALNNEPLARALTAREAPAIDKGAAAPATSSASSASNAPTATPTPTPAPRPASTFTVQPWPHAGSTLSGIAQIVYGNADLWPAIAEANHIAGPQYIIQPWQTLVIPPEPAK